MDFFQLSYEQRIPETQRVRELRALGKIPAVVYGHGFPTQAVTLNGKEFERFLARVHASPIVHLCDALGSPIPAVLKDIQRDALTEQVLHADFHRVRMEWRLTTTLSLELVGESPAVKERAGVLVKIVGSLDIECLPGDLVSSIPVDLSKLQQVHDRIRVSDLSVPNGIRVLNDPETIVVTVQEQRQEEIEPTKPVEDVSAVEVAGKKEKSVEEVEAEDVKGKKE